MGKLAENLRRLPVAVQIYRLKELPQKLIESSQIEKLHRYITDFDFIEAKISVLGVQPIIEDYDLALQPDIQIPEDKKETLKLIQGAIRLSTKVLADDPKQLAGQLIGRLMHYTQDEEIKEPKSLYWIPNFLGYLAIGISIVIVSPILILLILLVLTQVYIFNRIPYFPKKINTKERTLLQKFTSLTLSLFNIVRSRIYSLVSYTFFLLINIPAAIIGGFLPRKNLQLKTWINALRKLPQKVENTNDIIKILEQAKKSQVEPWLCPLIPNLTAPGGALLRTIEADVGLIEVIAITPDSKQVISSSSEAVIVWDVQTGAILKTLTKDNNFNYGVAISPNGKQVVSAFSDRTLIVWDLETENVLKTLTGYTGNIHRIIFTPDGKKAIAGSSDGTIIIWDLETGNILKTLNGHTAYINGIAITRDGKKMVSASMDTSLIVWDLETGNILKTLTGHTETVRAVVITPNGQTAISGSNDKKLIIWDLQTGNIVQIIESDPIISLAITPNGEYLISGSKNQKLEIWWMYEQRIPTPVRTFEKQGFFVCAIAVTSDNKLAISASGSRLRIWDLDSREKQKNNIFHHVQVNAVAITPDGQLAVSASDDHTLIVWDLQSGIALKSLVSHNQSVNAVTITPDGKHAISASDDKTLILWNLQTGLPLNIFEGHNQEVDTVAITPDGKVAVSTQSYELIVWDLNTGEILKKTTKFTEYSHRNVNAIFPDGQTIVSASSSFQNYGLILWDLWSEERIGTFIGHSEDITAITITPDGEKIISASGDKTIIIWNLLTGKILKTLRGHTSTVKAVAISPDEKYLVSVSSDRTIKVWNFETGEVTTSFSADSDIHCCAIAPDGVTIIVGEWSGRVHFLRLELSGNCI